MLRATHLSPRPVATVVYALCGTGRGHTSRATAMAEALRALGHRVLFASGDPNAADLPGEVFGVPALRQVVRSNRVRLGATARANRATARYSLDTIDAAARWLRLVRADVVVADHKPFGPRGGRRRRRGRPRHASPPEGRTLFAGSAPFPQRAPAIFPSSLRACTL